ncbi:hypothetical protein [Persicobacter diffluens]
MKKVILFFAFFMALQWNVYALKDQQATISKAQQAFVQQQYEDCLQLSQQALSEGDNDEAQLLEGLSYWYLGKKKSAEKSLKKAEKMGNLKACQILKSWKQ